MCSRRGRRPSLPPTITGPCVRRSRRSTGRRGPFAMPCTGFNMQTVLPERGITIDEALILLAQLSGRKDRLNELASRQPQERLGNRYFGSSNGPIEYRYANYDVARAEADYRAVADEIAALQLELDLVNQTEVFSVEL